jgi:hypothetical protein
MDEKILPISAGRTETDLAKLEDESVGDRFEFRDDKGGLVFEITPVGLDVMNPDEIEDWQLVMPLTAMLNEVGSIKVSYESVSGERSNSFIAKTLASGDKIILEDRKNKKSETIVVSINPHTMKLSLDLDKQLNGS